MALGFSWHPPHVGAQSESGLPAPWDRGVRFAHDSPLEGAGFEPSVPRRRERRSSAKSDPWEETRRHRVSGRIPKIHNLPAIAIGAALDAALARPLEAG
jgi:hypothetical protein